MFDPERDAMLMERVKNGDKAAFAEIFDLYAKAVGKFLFNLTRDRQSAEDGVQEVFLRLWRSAARYDPSGKFSTYLFQIAKNWGLSEIDRSRRKGGKPPDDPRSDDPERSPADLSPGPDGAALAREDAERVRDAIASLSDKLRATFVLAVLEGVPYKDVAAMLDVPVGTVKSRVAAAEKALREKLEKE